MELGGTGVDLFFVLSGFLISGLLFSEFEKNGRINAPRFLIRRAFKIYPPFYALLLVTAATFLILGIRVPRVLFVDAIFLQNYLPHFWEHGWSLAVEEHFYLLLPVLFSFLIWSSRGSRNPFRVIPAISIFLSAICLLLRIQALRHGADFAHIAFPTHLRADALFAGVSLGYFSRYDRESFSEARKWWVLSLGLSFAATMWLLPNIPTLTFAYVAAAFIVAWAANQPAKKAFLSRPIAWIGYYSYSIYVWHVVALILLQHIPAAWYRFPLYFIAAVSLGAVMAKIIELPSLAVRERLFPSGAKPKAVGAVITVGMASIPAAPRVEPWLNSRFVSH